MATILTCAEQRDGKLRRASLETVSEARRLAGALGADVTAVVVGPGSEPLSGELASYGADRVVVFDDAAFATYATEAKPSVVLVPFTAIGKDLAPRVSAKIGAGLASDCVGFEVNGATLAARRPIYAGKAYATVEWTEEPRMATLRPNVFPLGQPNPARKAEVKKATVDTASRARVAEVKAAGAGKVELAEAQIVVSGGRGLKGPE